MEAMGVWLRLAGRFSGRCGRLLLVAMVFLCVAALSGATPALAVPGVDSYSPSEVNAGAMVDINGRDLGLFEKAGQTRIKYGTDGSPTGEIALGDILSWSSTRIRVKLPVTMPAGVYWLAIYRLDTLRSNQLRGLTVRVSVYRPGPITTPHPVYLAPRPPTRTGTTWQLGHEANNPIYCGLRTRGTGPTITDPGAGSVMYGYSNSYDPGTEPLPCWEKIDHTFRGMVLFDLSDLRGKTIERAVLSFRVLHLPPSWRLSCGSDPLSNLYTLSQDWSAGFREGHISHGAAAGVMGEWGIDGYTRDISDLVRQWVSGRLPNYGLVLVGRDETYRKATDVCVSHASGFSLRVNYRP